MKPLRVFSSNLELLAEIDDYESLVITRKWHTYGEIDLVIHQDKRHVDKLINGNILLPGNDVKSAAVIRHRESDLDTLKIKAPLLGSYMAQRVIVPTEITGAAETVMKQLVDKQAVNPDNPYPAEELLYFSLPFFPAQTMWRKPYREFKLLSLAPDLGRGKVVTRQGKYQPLSEELESISRETGLGWGIRLGDGELVFEVYEGNDRSITGDRPVIFSPDFDNVMGQSFVDSQFETKNVVYGGSGTEVIEAGYSFGAERFEGFVSVPDDEDAEKYTERALQETIFTLEAEAVGGAFIYRKDYDLGDIVTIQNKKWGIQRNARITQVQEVYEPLNMQVYVTFGESPPTLIDKVKSEIKRLGVR